jgi:hypothetical protein
MNVRSVGFRVTVIVAVLVSLALLANFAGGGLFATLRRMHGHP